jgi:NACalpha-BTF3-like transcription factor
MTVDGDDKQKKKKNASVNADADENDNDNDDETQPQPPPTGQAAEQSKALGSLNSAAAHEEDKEIDADSAAKAAQGVHSLHQAVQLQKAKAAERERALAAVKVSSGDVDVVAGEFELKKPEAERVLREAGGDLRRALEKLCGGGGGGAA